MSVSEAQPCRYCTNAERTKEHALAKQLAALIPHARRLTAERLTVDTAKADSLSEWSTGTAANVLVRDFCADCNSGFMNDLDHSVKAEFGRLCRGEPLELDATAAARWAIWATKQYLSYQAAYPEDYSRRSDYETFYEKRQPLADMHVYLALGETLPWPHIHARRPLFVTDPANGRRTVGLQIWTAAYGQLVVQVVHIQDTRVRIPLRTTDDVSRFWPEPPPRVDLARLRRLDEAGFAALTKLEPLLAPRQAPPEGSQRA